MNGKKSFFPSNIQWIWCHDPHSDHLMLISLDTLSVLYSNGSFGSWCNSLLEYSFSFANAIWNKTNQLISGLLLRRYALALGIFPLYSIDVYYRTVPYGFRWGKWLCVYVTIIQNLNSLTIDRFKMFCRQRKRSNASVIWCIPNMTYRL